MSVKLTLKGFDSYLNKLRKAGANVQKVSEKALLESAVMFNSELEKNVKASPMSEATKDEINKSLIKPQITHSSDMLVIANAGFRIGNYDRDDPSGGFIALFNEYGTEDRTTRSGENRGSLEKMEFTKRTHRKVDAKIRKLQEGILKEALKELGE